MGKGKERKGRNIIIVGIAYKCKRKGRKVFRIGTVHYNWPMSAHASQAFSIAHFTDLEDLPKGMYRKICFHQLTG